MFDFLAGFLAIRALEKTIKREEKKTYTKLQKDIKKAVREEMFRTQISVSLPKERSIRIERKKADLDLRPVRQEVLKEDRTSEYREKIVQAYLRHDKKVNAVRKRYDTKVNPIYARYREKINQVCEEFYKKGDPVLGLKDKRTKLLKAACDEKIRQLEMECEKIIKPFELELDSEIKRLEAERDAIVAQIEAEYICG